MVFNFTKVKPRSPSYKNKDKKKKNPQNWECTQKFGLEGIFHEMVFWAKIGLRESLHKGRMDPFAKGLFLDRQEMARPGGKHGKDLSFIHISFAQA